MTYGEILCLPFEEFFDYLDRYEIFCPEQMTSAQEQSRLLTQIANSYTEVQGLLSRATYMKRVYKNNGDRQLYTEMIDKENALENTAKALDMAYKAARSAVTIYLKELDELKYADYTG